MRRMWAYQLHGNTSTQPFHGLINNSQFQHQRHHHHFIRCHHRNPSMEANDLQTVLDHNVCYHCYPDLLHQSQLGVTLLYPLQCRRHTSPSAVFLFLHYCSRYCSTSLIVTPVFTLLSSLVSTQSDDHCGVKRTSNIVGN